jgi:hypothetical protein
MKRIFFVLWFIFLLSAFLFACGGGGGGSDSADSVKRTIHGKAAIGAYIEQGAQVQVRPSAVDGVPCEIIEAVVGADGSYEVVIPEEIVTESAVKSTTKGSLSVDSVDGFLVRVYSSAVGAWVYSYAENDSVDMVANTNPFTDYLIRQFYKTGNNDNPHSNSVADKNIDSVFTSGTFDDTTAINIPDAVTIDIVMQTMSNMLARNYDMAVTQNALVDAWQVDVGLDALLNHSVYPRLDAFLQDEFKSLFFDPEVITDALCRQNEVGDPINIEIWTPYGNTGNVTLTYNNNGTILTYTMVKQADSTAGNNHFKVTTTTITQVINPAVYIVIDDYNSGMGFEVAIVRK